MKFLVDMPLSPALAVWLRQQGHEAVHASEVALDKSPDEVLLNSAHRVVIEKNRIRRRRLPIDSSR